MVAFLFKNMYSTNDKLQFSLLQIEILVDVKVPAFCMLNTHSISRTQLFQDWFRSEQSFAVV